MKGLLTFKDGTKVDGMSFGHESSTAGEIVFTTGIVGYPKTINYSSYTPELFICITSS